MCQQGSLGAKVQPHVGPFSFRARPFQSPADYTRIPSVLEPSWHEVNIYTFETESTEKKGKHASGPVTGEVGYSLTKSPPQG